ncbi:MAG: helix-turn-helix domain-containing protein [Patescibacteria group bacterium]
MPKPGSPISKILVQIGLTDKEAVVYEALLTLGKAGMGELLKKIPYKRGNTYDLMRALIDKGLVTETMTKGKKVFVIEPPERIKVLLDEREKTVQQQAKTLNANYESLNSLYRITMNKPGVRFYEGIEGIKLVLKDTIVNNTSKQIKTFSDVAGYAKYLKVWNQSYYAPLRKKLGIIERVIIPDNAEALAHMRSYQANEVTQILFIDHKNYPFATEINIYENKVSFVTFSDRAHIGIIIDNMEIFQTFSSVFELCWSLGSVALKNRQPDYAALSNSVPASVERRDSTGSTT